MEKEKFIGELCKENSTFSSARQAETFSNLLDTVSSDIYSESQRFVFELIQNADDAAQSNNNVVHFDFLPNTLIVSHNGKPFDDKDIISLTGAGASTKMADPTKTGYKGIGFKSVFGKSERVTIFSGGYQFRFDKSAHKSKLPWQIIPIWTKENELSVDIQKSISKNTYSVSTIIEISKTDLLERDLTELLENGQILLFLRKVSKIIVSKNSSILYSIEKKVVTEDNNFHEIVLIKNTKEISSWITQTFDRIPVPTQTKDELKHDDKTPEKLKEAEFTEVSFAAKVEDGKIRSLKKEYSLIFTYLPTKVTDFEFPFLVNGSFITNAAREGLHEDRVWNQWLFQLIGEKIFEWLSLLANSKYKFQLLHLLPHKFNSSQNELKKTFDNSFSKNCILKPFIITANENIKRTDEVVLDKSGLSSQSFVDPVSITEYIKIEKGLIFGNDCFVNIKVEESSKLKAVGVETFSLENFENFFISESFTSRHPISANYELIKYCRDKSDNDKQGIWFQTLRTLPFIYDEKGILYNPSNGICFPTGVNATELGEIPVINSEVFRKIQTDNAIFEWLKKLGVKEPSQVAYVTNVIIPNLHKPDFISESNFLQITHYLFRLFKENRLDEDMLESLRELKLKTKKAGVVFIEAQSCFLANKYQPQLRIEGLISDVFYVSEEYLFSDSHELEWNLFFKAIKVKDRVEVEVINKNNSLPTLRTLTSKIWVDECSKKARETPGAFGFGEHNVINDVRIPSFLNLIPFNYEYGKIFWRNIIGSRTIFMTLIENAKYKYGIGYGQNQYERRVENYFPWFINNEYCIPTSTQQILKPQDVFINDKEIKQIAGNFLPVFEYDDPLPDDWKNFLKLKERLDLQDYLMILEAIAEKTEEDENLKKNDFKKIGLIFNKLASLLPGFSDEKKETIRKWGSKNKLPSSNGKFEKANELKWIKIEGFKSDSEKLKVIQLPENCETKSATFEELMSLFQVIVIDKFSPKFLGAKTDVEFKAKLQNILPFFASIIEKRQYGNYSKEFERMFAIVNNFEFLNASEIRLSFEFQNETIAGPSLNIFKDQSKLYFKGRWKSPITMFTLLPELAGILEVVGLNDELRLLLELDESETIDWLVGLGYNITSLRATSEYQKAKQKVRTEQPEKAIVGVSEVEYTDNKETEPIEEQITDDETEKVDIVSMPESFKPIVEPEAFDVSKITATKKIFASINQIAESNYAKIESQEVREDVGLWSERFVYEFLVKEPTFSGVIWENQNGESGKPYDFKVFENGKEKFIDVKGTPSGTKDVVYLSPNEWIFMFDKAENYSIYRVYNAGTPDAKIEITENPSYLLQHGKIFPNPITLQV